MPGCVPGQAIRVALLTDMHGPHNWIDQDNLVGEIGQFRPHLICIVGDAIDDRGDEPLVRRYAELEAPLGKFATLGNWEYQGGCDLDRLNTEYRRAGVKLLVNEHVRVGDPQAPLDVVGLDDWRAGSPDYRLVHELPDAVHQTPRAIVLSHCPVPFDAIARTAHRPVVVLAGHTHGGQIAPFGKALVLPEGSGRYVKGTYTNRDTEHVLYVSRGLGNSGPPFRIGSRPELALLSI
jgi:predicted MPP superfamily phosphohydrolase